MARLVASAHDEPARRPAVERLAHARSFAVVGASDRSDVHRVALENLTASPGISVVGINPRRREVHGVPCVPSATELPGPVDAALLLLADPRIEEAAEEAMRAGVGALIVPGLALRDGHRDAAERIAARARELGVLMLGVDCMGYAAPGELLAWIGTMPPGARAGRLGVAVQSGAVGEALIAMGGRLGLRCVASVGNESACDVADFCEFFARDERTNAVGLLVETVRRPRPLLDALRRLADAGKPVVCLKVGRSAAAARAVRAHSGADVGDGDAFAAFARSAGVIEVPDYPHFLETLAVLDAPRRPGGTRIGAVTNSGGEAALLADQAAAAGAPFGPVSPALASGLSTVTPNGIEPTNPLDAWWPGDVAGTYRAALRLMAASGEFDVLVAQIDQTPHLTSFEREHAVGLARVLFEVCEQHDVVPAVVSAQPSEPVPEVAELAAEAGAALVRANGVGLSALVAVGRWAGARRRPAEEPDASLEPVPAGERGDAGLDAVALLERYGLWALPPGDELDADWNTVASVMRRDPHFGAFVRVGPVGDRALGALLPLDARSAADLVRDAGADVVGDGLAAELGQSLVALSRLAAEQPQVRSAGLLHAVTPAGPRLLRADLDLAQA